MIQTCFNCQDDKVFPFDLGKPYHSKYLCKACFSAGYLIDEIEFKEQNGFDLQCSFCLDDDMTKKYFDLVDSQVCNNCMDEIGHKCTCCGHRIKEELHLDQSGDAFCARCINLPPLDEDDFYERIGYRAIES